MDGNADDRLKTIDILLRQPLTQSSEAEADLVAQCIAEIERFDGQLAHLHFLGGAGVQSDASFRENFERRTGAPFTPRNFRKHRLSMIRNADAFINLRTAMSESTAFEVAYNLFSGTAIPMFFAVWRKAPIRTTLIRDLQDLGDVTYVEFDEPRELRRPLWTFLRRVCGLAGDEEVRPATRNGQAGHAIAPAGTGKSPGSPAPRHTGLLVLADGQVFRGQGIGVEGRAAGELCFNTAMTGYQEILSDPSYAGQIVTFSFPHVGNTGVNDEDMEASVPLARGCVLHEPVTPPSSHRAQALLPGWLALHGMTGIAGVDTREIVRLLREEGAQNCVVTHDRSGVFDIDALRAAAAQETGPLGQDMASGATTAESFDVDGATTGDAAPKPRVVVVDYGVKGNIVANLVRRGIDVTVVPAEASSKDILAHDPDGILLSNGPGDPMAVAPYTVPMIETLLERKLPFFGICLGHQLLALALGGKVTKMHFGHHGANHPVLEKASGRVAITSQNHGFVVERDSLPENAHVTHVSLFDGSLAGFEAVGEQILSVQYHPEASPGPHDAEPLFDRFAVRVKNHRIATQQASLAA